MSVNLNGQAAVGADLDMGANEITSTTGDLKLDASGDINAQTNKITNVVNPTAAQDAATKAYVDSTVAGIDELIEDTTPQLGGNWMSIVLVLLVRQTLTLLLILTVLVLLMSALAVLPVLLILPVHKMQLPINTM